jgi:1-acyl-sn-glycerol-3-phosphate acyltransferase
VSGLHAWHPHASCDASCVRVDPVGALGRFASAVRAAYRLSLIIALLPVMPFLALPLPGQTPMVRMYWRFFVRCMGVRITLSGGPIRNLPGVLVVSGHVSWLDAFVIYSLMPTTFVAKKEVTEGPGLSSLARVMKIIPIDRSNLRHLPEVVDTVTERLRSGQSVVAFPEGTTWCGLAHGEFRPAMFQAAIDAGRPVQPLRLSYRQRDGRPSTAPAFVGEDTLLASILRVVSTRSVLANVHVEELQLPGEHRRELAVRCQEVVRGTDAARREHALAA